MRQGTAEFAPWISARRLIYIDSCAAAVEAASSRRLEAQQADIEEPSFADGYFEVVTSDSVLYHLPDRDRGMAELAQDLGSEGRFVCMYYLPDHFVGRK
ncbi:MAG: methyltransferase domain-containing protein [Candidatus Dormiibacterota bacterium]